MIEAINSLFIIKTEDKVLISEGTGYLKISFCHKIRLITHCFPNKKYKKFLKDGNVKVDKEFDIVEIITDLRHVHP